MSQRLVISDELYTRLSAAARQRGLEGIEQLLEAWQAGEEERQQRSHAVEQIDALRSRLLATYGEMPDSTALVHEDRER